MVSEISDNNVSIVEGALELEEEVNLRTDSSQSCKK